MKHARAHEVVVTMVGKDQSLRMIVDDDGQGFDTHAALEFSQHIKGIGLFSIREWVTTMEGTFSAESEKEKGTRVLITIPVPEMREANDD